MTLLEANNKHLDYFGVEPRTIGRFWNKRETLISMILKSIKDNIKYDEYEMLSKEEQKFFDEGKLRF